MLKENDIPALIGGRAEIEDLDKHFRRRGEIKSIRLEGTMLVVDFIWVEKQEIASDSGEWTENPTLVYTACLGSFSRVDLGNGTIRLNSRTRNDTVTLFPPGLEEAEPAAVTPLFVEEDELQVAAA